MPGIQDQRIAALIAAKSIDALLKLPSDEPIALADVDGIREALWTKYAAEVKADPTRAGEDATSAFTFAILAGKTSTATVRTLAFNGKTMRFTTAQNGTKPTAGYPLVISLHGGGGIDDATNNELWKNQQSFWSGDVSPGLYVVPRGITNAWNLHFDDDSYPLYDRLIEDLVVFHEVDPNRVYVMGFSAGGDGVYQIAARMPDRFGAVSMMAGHPNGVSVHNYRNLGFQIQMGQNDAAFGRNQQAANYDGLLNQEVALDPTGYAHATYIHPGGDHNSWQATTYTAPQPNPVLTNPADVAKPNAATTNANTAAYTWMSGYKRNPYPARVAFDPNTRADGRKAVDVTTGARLWRGLNRAYQAYWVDVGANSATYATVDVRLETAGNRVSVVAFGTHLRLLVHESMVNLGAPLDVVVDGATYRVQPALSLKTMVRTLVDRGDRNFAYPAEVYVEKVAGRTQVFSPGRLSFTGPDGGAGTYFEDQPPIGARLTALTVWSGDVLDALQATYGTGALPKHGGGGGGASPITFAADEYVTEIRGSTGMYFGATHVFGLIIKTNRTTYGPYGSGRFVTQPTPFVRTAGIDLAYVAFCGRSLRHSDGSEFISALGAAARPVGSQSQTVSGSGNGASIPAVGSTGTVCFKAAVSLTRPVTDVNVWLDLDHSNTGSLKIELVSPQGTAVTLSGNRGAAGDNFRGTTFDDQAAAAIAAGTAPFSGAYRPDEPLSAFIGECAAGDWMLRITDSQQGDQGVMHSWQIFVTTM